MTQETKTPARVLGSWLKTSITARLFMVGTLCLLLLIPLVFVEDLIYERSHRQSAMVEEIYQKWGNQITIYGPILAVPYKNYTKKMVGTKKDGFQMESIEHQKTAYFFPEQLQIEGNLQPEEKKRGIYNTVVYKSKLQIDGSFQKPNFESLEIKEKDIIWEKAHILFQTSNVKGIKGALKIKLGAETLPFTAQFLDEQNHTYQNLNKLQTASFSIHNTFQKNSVPFSMQLHTHGSERIRIIPVGRNTETRLQSTWKTAKFDGAFFPYNSDKINENGFDAKWQVGELNRPFPQSYANNIPSLTEYAYGVDFKIPVDEYQKSTRSAKYGFLVISLTFLVFFLIQTLSKIHIHPFQYLMIGLALVMFYTLLISISEHSSYRIAYGIAGTAVIVLIGLYSKTVLGSWRFPIFISLSLIALYSFIFVIIQLENYALLVGSIGLFSILATIMFVSRKIEWQSAS